MKEYRKRAKILQAMSHPVRLQILEILAQGPNCVCDLIARTRQRQAYISQHLMLLRQTGMVKSTRLGLQMQYELAKPEITKNLLKCVLQNQQCEGSKQGETNASAVVSAPPPADAAYTPSIMKPTNLWWSLRKCAWSAAPPAPPSAYRMQLSFHPRDISVRSSKRTKLSPNPKTCCAPTQKSTMSRNAHLWRDNNRNSIQYKEQHHEHQNRRRLR